MRRPFISLALAALLTGGFVPSVNAVADAWDDVSISSGISGPLDNSYVHAAAWGDIDDNGWPDLFAGTFVVGATTVPNTLLLNDTGQFADSGQDALAVDGRAAGAVLADLDGDGDLDVVVSNNAKPNRSGPRALESKLYRNDDGVFVDVTEGSGLDAQNANGRQVAAFDHDGDADLDLLILGGALNGTGPTVLLRNDGSLVFTDITAAAGLPADIHGLGSAVGDVDRDGWPDLFIAGGPEASDNRNYLFVSERDGTYRDATPASLDWNPFENGPEDWVSSGAFGDIDRDGDLDLLVGHHFGSSEVQGVPTPVRLYRNDGVDETGNPVFTDITEEVVLPGLSTKAPHVDIQDIDNDGWPDLYASLTVTTATGGVAPLVFRHTGMNGDLPSFETPSLTDQHYYPGGPLADFDRDGDLDAFLPEFRSVYGQGVVPSLLLKNDSADGNWLDVVVDGPAMGVGAVVEVFDGGSLVGMDEVALGYGFSSAGEASVHFGLGSAGAVDVVVTLPRNGGVVTLTDVAANQRIAIDAGEPPPPPPPPPPPDEPIPVALWHFEEGLGTIAADGTGSGHDLELFGGAGWTLGHDGGGVSFDGLDARLTGAGSPLNGANDLTVTMWVAADGARGRQTLLSGLGIDNPDEIELTLLSGGRLLVYTGEGRTRVVLQLGVLADGSWHHLAVVRHASEDEMVAYVDGVEVASAGATLNSLVVEQLVLGNDLTSVDGALARKRGFDGTLDEVAVYRSALTSAQIAALANGVLDELVSPNSVASTRAD